MCPRGGAGPARPDTWHRLDGPDRICQAANGAARPLSGPSCFRIFGKGRVTILDHLNPEQREAACAVEGPVLIFAGAGSGKTRTLTHRLAYMVKDCGIPPEQILAVTFTNKAANEMKERIRLLIGDQAERLWTGTFHWFCVRLLRAEGKAMGIRPDFTIYDEADSLTVVKHALSGLNISTELTKPPAVLNEISQAKNQLKGVSEYRAGRSNPLQQAAQQVYRVYQEQLRKNNALDFDDLLMLAVQLLDQHAEVRRKYQERFPYLLVDEYQDINYAQFRLLQLLAGQRSNLCVVGDDDQSIYGWRGADVGLILAFREHYPQAQVFRLERNYRSTQRILDCANAVISRNPERAPKRLWTENEPGEDVVLYAAVNEEEEAEWVVDTIQRQVACGAGTYGDFAVLYRINAMSRVFEEALMAQNIPYEVVGGMRFFDRAEIKDLVAYLQVVQNPDNSLALRRIINMPTRGIGESALGILDRLALTQQVSLWEALRLAVDDATIPVRMRHAFQEFVDLIEGLIQGAQEMSLPQLARAVVQRSGYLQRLKDSARADDARRAENVEEFVSVAARFVARRGEGTGLPEFLEYLALSSDIDQAEALGEKVALLTLHSAKGLEFPGVFLVGLEENILPHYRSVGEEGEEDEAQIAEERRLLYVGMTRAQRRLWLSRAERRLQFGQVVENPPSRFLRDLPQEGVVRRGAFASSGRTRPQVRTDEQPEMAMSGRPLDLPCLLSRARLAAARREQEPAEVTPAPTGAATEEWRIGDRVMHPKFGRGMVVSASSQAGTTEITVAFPGQGLKKLDARYARLEKA